MAADTTTTITLTAKDWELLIGIFFHSTDPEMMDMYIKLVIYYNTTTPKPSSNSPISIETTESVVVKLTNYLYGNTVRNVTKDEGANPFNRIMGVLRALNNVNDNYISDELAIIDAANVDNIQQIRKNGRLYIMNKGYDNV